MVLGVALIQRAQVSCLINEGCLLEEYVKVSKCQGEVCAQNGQAAFLFQLSHSLRVSRRQGN